MQKQSMENRCLESNYGILSLTVITPQNTSYNVKKCSEGIFLKDYIEERAINIANYIIENNATVRQTARQFGISKSTVHMVVIK